jgi:hypothetical protein
MSRFRKKPVVIEAVQLTPHSLNAVEPDLCSACVEQPVRGGLG